LNAFIVEKKTYPDLPSFSISSVISSPYAFFEFAKHEFKIKHL
jgi:hypothetical protein